jgi:hypothetical protein
MRNRYGVNRLEHVIRFVLNDASQPDVTTKVAVTFPATPGGAVTVPTGGVGLVYGDIGMAHDGFTAISKQTSPRVTSTGPDPRTAPAATPAPATPNGTGSATSHSPPCCTPTRNTAPRFTGAAASQQLFGLVLEFVTRGHTAKQMLASCRISVPTPCVCTAPSSRRSASTACGRRVPRFRAALPAARDHRAEMSGSVAAAIQATSRHKGERNARPRNQRPPRPAGGRSAGAMRG